MEKHIILAAFGTTSLTKNTYSVIENRVRLRFPDCILHWAYSSPRVRRGLAARNIEKIDGIRDILRNIPQAAQTRTVIQSLHVLPGKEFHRVVREAAACNFQGNIGMPLLSTPDDFAGVAAALSPLVQTQECDTVLVLGHGSDHPSWTAYPALEQALYNITDKRIHVASLEKYPGSATIIDKLLNQGSQKVLIIPFLLAAGMHFKRDITGDKSDAWENRLKQKNIRCILHDAGIGQLSGIADIFCDHIAQAFSN